MPNVKLLAAVLSLADAAMGAQAPGSVLGGVYTEAQAQRGKPLYAEACAACHAPDLSGFGPIPALAGPAFQTAWPTAGDLFEKIRTTMPSNAPGSLTDDDVADLLAHIFRVTRYPAGSTPLPAAAEPLRAIGIEPSERD